MACVSVHLFLQLMVHRFRLLSGQLVALEMKYFVPTFIYVHVILGILSFISADLIEGMINYFACLSVFICEN